MIVRLAGLAILVAAVLTGSMWAAGDNKPSEDEPQYEMVKYYMALLRRGPAWTAEQTPEVRAVLDGHFANMERLEKAGTLILAGPFEDPNEQLAGMFLFKVDSQEEAERLTATDPAIQAGRFEAEVVPWWGPSTLRY